MRYTAQKQSVNYYHDQNYRAVIAVWFVTSERFAHSKIHHLIIMRYNRCHSNDNPGSPNRLLYFVSIAPIRIDPCQATCKFRDTIRAMYRVHYYMSFQSQIACLSNRFSHDENFARNLYGVLIFSIYIYNILTTYFSLIKFLFFLLF